MNGFLDEFGDPLALLLETGNEVTGPILKKHDKAECEKHKKREPKERADETHVPRLTD